MKAILVKVAGAGLQPTKHLGKDLASLSVELKRLHARYGLDLCGEGGEYESLVCDLPYFTRSIEVLDSEVLIDPEDCDVGNLRVTNARLIEKPGHVSKSVFDTDGVSDSFSVKFKAEAEGLLTLYTVHLLLTRKDEVQLVRYSNSIEYCTYEGRVIDSKAVRSKGRIGLQLTGPFSSGTGEGTHVLSSLSYIPNRNTPRTRCPMSDEGRNAPVRGLAAGGGPEPGGRHVHPLVSKQLSLAHQLYSRPSLILLSLYHQVLERHRKLCRGKQGILPLVLVH